MQKRIYGAMEDILQRMDFMMIWGRKNDDEGHFVFKNTDHADTAL